MSQEDFEEGRARLLVDSAGNALVPKPEGLYDEEDDWEGLQAAQESLADGEKRLLQSGWLGTSTHTLRDGETDTETEGERTRGRDRARQTQTGRGEEGG